METARAILSRVVTPDPPVNFEFDRVHGALGARSMDPDRPRDVICRLHRYAVKERMLRDAWVKGPIDFDGASVTIFVYVTRGTLQRRAVLKPFLEKLRTPEVT